MVGSFLRSSILRRPDLPSVVHMIKAILRKKVLVVIAKIGVWAYIRVHAAIPTAAQIAFR